MAHHHDGFALFEVEPDPYLKYDHQGYISSSLVELRDGSFVSCHHNSTAKHLTISMNEEDDDFRERVVLVGTFVGHEQNFTCVLEKDDDTLLSGSHDLTLRVWNKATHKCLSSHDVPSVVWSMALTTDKTKVMCGSANGRVDARRLSDLGLVSSFEFHSDRVRCLIGLEDGDSYVSASDDSTMKRWDEQGRTLQTFLGHTQLILKVIELRRDILVSGSFDRTLKVWNTSSGECLRTINQSFGCGPIKLSDDRFLFYSFRPYPTLKVFNDSGVYLREYNSVPVGVVSMVRLSKTPSILIDTGLEFEIRRLFGYESSSVLY